VELSVGYGMAASFIAKSGALDTPFVLVDIGVRDGIHPRWLPFEPAMQVFGFDAIAEVVPPNERHHYFKLALGDYDGECAFDIPENLYEARATPDGAHKIPIAKLDTLWQTQALPAADFIKIDCEGYEPEVLRGAEQYLQAGNTLGADIETSFHISPTLPSSHFAAIAPPLLQNRLLVADFAFGAAQGSAWNGTCNVLFTRHLIQERNSGDCYAFRRHDPNPSLDAVLKTIAIFDVYALVGPAVALLQEFSDLISQRIDPELIHKRLMLPPPRAAGIERFLPHLGLGLWTGIKRLTGQT
jgi:FkbM family methyltransferase